MSEDRFMDCSIIHAQQLDRHAQLHTTTWYMVEVTGIYMRYIYEVTNNKMKEISDFAY